MRYSWILIAVAAIGCGKKKTSGVTQFGTSGVAIDMSWLDVPNPEQFLKESAPGYWHVDASFGMESQGSTYVTVKRDRGMPTKSNLENSVAEHRAMGDTGSVEEGPHGMLIEHWASTHCSSCSKDHPQYFAYAYLPTKDGAALCEGWSEKSATDKHIEICKTLQVMPGNEPSASAPAPSAAAPSAPAPPAPPKP
jgi:hypothetical protein